LVSVVVGVIAVLDVRGTDQVNLVKQVNEVNAAILLVLALLATTILRDRMSAAQALTSASAVHLLSGLEVSQEHAEARRATRTVDLQGGNGDLPSRGDAQGVRRERPTGEAPAARAAGDHRSD